MHTQGISTGQQEVAMMLQDLNSWRAIRRGGAETFVRCRPHRQHEFAAGGDFSL